MTIPDALGGFLEALERVAARKVPPAAYMTDMAITFNADKHPRFEPWPEAYTRIFGEVRVEMPEANRRDQYIEYRRRCEKWKRDRGIR